MIVDYNRKFIFIGLPFSACSAISKELLEHYKCETLLHKHASIPALLLAWPDIKISDFEIIAVVRDPLDASLTLYHWLKDNRNGHFTRPENYVENGGTVTRRHRKLYSAIQKKNMTFNQYLEYCFKFIPYDSLLSENSRYLTRIIRYENLQDDFKKCFGSLGLKIDRDLPFYNETENKIDVICVDPQRYARFYGPFMMYNARHYQDMSCYKKLDVNSVSRFVYFKYYLFRVLKGYYRLYLDMRFIKRKISHVD